MGSYPPEEGERQNSAFGIAWVVWQPGDEYTLSVRRITSRCPVVTAAS